ncbi:MAG: SseB family protein [Rhodoluna sp.]
MSSTEPSKFTDSAGVPWAGRSFDINPYSGDNGEADAYLIESISKFQSGQVGCHEVLRAIGHARLLIPLIANLGEGEQGSHGHQVDKSADLSIVTVLTPDNQRALPVFSSVATMTRWNPDARPVPNNGRKVALAAASEGNTRLVLDPMSETEFVVRRPGIAAVAQELPWITPANNPEVVEIINNVLAESGSVESFTLVEGDPSCKLLGQELLVVLYLEPGLSEKQLKELEDGFFEKIANSERFVELVDSVGVKFLQAS